MAVDAVNRYSWTSSIGIVGRHHSVRPPGYRLKRVLDHIGDNFAEDLSLSQLAAVAGMSPHYFAQLFKMSTGYAPHKYVLLQRIERAKQELRDSQHNILEVALAVGFQNP